MVWSYIYPFATIFIMKKLITKLMEDEGLPSVGAAVVQDGKPMAAQAVGMANLASSQSATVSTIYHLGSVTKIFTAVHLTQLQHEQKISLDAPITDYLPELKAFALPPISLKQLVSHTSGLPLMPPLPELDEMMAQFPPSLEMMAAIQFPTIERIIEAVANVELIGQPNEQVSYSNLGVALLAEAMRRATGVPYREAIRQRILQPLGMSDSGFLEDVVAHPSAAINYLPFFDPPQPAPEAMKRIGGFEPTGGIWASVNDMVRFMQFLTSDMPNAPLERPFLLQMTELIAQQDGPRYTEGGEETAVSGVGIGWFLTQHNGEWVAEHGGADPGTAVHLAWMPHKNRASFIATNTGQNPAAIAEANHQLLQG